MALKRVLTTEDLNGMQCANCSHTPEHDHEEFYIHARCHMDAPPWFAYKDGVLIVQCSVCDAEVTRIAVSDNR